MLERLCRISSVVLGSALYGCHQASGRGLEIVPVVDTVRVRYQSEGYQFAVVSKVVNHTSKAAHFDRCSYDVQFLDGNQWRTVDASICAMDLGSWVTPAQGFREIPIIIHDDRSYRVLTRRGPLQSGKYRVRFTEIGRPKRWFAKRDTGFRISNPFTVIIQPITPPNTR